MFENAKWITSPDNTGLTPRMYFKDLNVIMPLKRATLYITACGVYEAYVGGVKVGRQVLTPGFTSFANHHIYNEYDITSLVAESDYLTVSVGSGWYSGAIAHGHFPAENAYALIAEIKLEYAGGLSGTIVTDESWTCGIGNVTFSDIYLGEHYDARCEPTLDGEVKVLDIDKTPLMPQDGEDIIEHDIFTPVSIFTTPRGETVVDLGVEITGYPFLEGLTAKSGETAELSFGEVLDKDGNFYNENYRKATSDFKYICKDGVQSYKPRHTYYGFRYMRIDSFPEGADPMKVIKATDVFSDMKRTGHFECGVDMVNKLYENVIRGQKGNFLDVPTDCPQRDERLGWTGDAQVFCRTAAYNYDTAKFYKKWLVDLRADQRENGAITHTVPHIGWGNDAAAWDEACAIVPYTMYVMYGDKSYLSDMIPTLKRYVEHLRGQGENEFLLLGKPQPHGDWLGLDDPSGKSHVGATDREYIAAVFYSAAVKILAKSMDILWLDGSEYFTLYDNILSGMRMQYPIEVLNTQTACVLALYFDIYPEEVRPEIAEKLVSMIHERGDSFTTGFVGTPYILHALSRYGYSDLAYTLLLRKEYPSWLYPITKGATTIWEHWDGIKPDGSMWDVGMNSFNHYAYGSVADWIYGVVCGIMPSEEEDGVGFKKISLAPIPDKRLGYAKASYECTFGKIVSEWRYDGDSVRYHFEIPEGVTAALTIGDKTEMLTGGIFDR